MPGGLPRGGGGGGMGGFGIDWYISQPVWENLNLNSVHRARCIRSVPMTLVKILPYRPAARLIRVKK